MTDDKDAASFDFDALQIWRCPQLGGPVNFGYCRVMNSDSPCTRIVHCWGGAIDVAAALARWYSPEQLAALLATPSPDRLTRIVDTLHRVAKRPEKE